MVMPFGVYYYAVLSRVLTVVQGSPLNWLDELYMRHIFSWRWPWLEPLRTGSLWLFKTGLALFLVHAVYLYWMKFVRKSIADRLLYAYVRHPQYLFLLIAGLGVALRWPRFLDLILWLVMAGAYLWLAGDEERRMLAAKGDAYAAYRQRTAMFFPGQPGERLARLLFPESRRRIMGFAAFALATIAVAFLVRWVSVRTLPTFTSPAQPRTLLISPESQARSDPAPLLAALHHELGDPQPGQIRVVFLLRDPDVAGHLMLDSGIEGAFPRYAATPDASVFLMVANATRPGRALTDPRDALGLSVVRKPRSMFYLPRRPRGLALKLAPWGTVYPHASVPVL